MFIINKILSAVVSKKSAKLTSATVTEVVIADLADQAGNLVTFDLPEELENEVEKGKIRMAR